MKTDRELLRVAFTGFLAGVVLTLSVLLFFEQREWYARLVILGVLIMLEAVSLAVTLLVIKGRLNLGGQASVSQEGVKPVHKSTHDAAPAATASPDSANDPNLQGRKPEPTRREVPPTRAEYMKMGRSPEAAPPARLAGNEFFSASTVWEPADPYQEPVPGAVESTYSAADHPGRLVEIWESYRRKGEGRFNAQGLRQKIELAGITAEVLPGEQFGAADNFLAVNLRVGGPLYLLPNFNKPARSVSQWFQVLGPESRTAVIQRLIRPATARRSGGRLEIETLGEIE